MTKKAFGLICLLMIALIMSACGTVATPVWEAPTSTPVTVDTETIGRGEAVAAVASPTSAPPTSTPTPLPPTPTLTPEPPTAEPTVAQVTDPITLQVKLSNAANGEKLFNTEFETSSGPWMCATCHSLVKDEVKIGPSQYGVALRAGTRIEGMVAERYLYNSIVHPKDYTVPEFEADVDKMPQDFATILSESQLLDLVAYLMTLDDE